MHVSLIRLVLLNGIQCCCPKQNSGLGAVHVHVHACLLCYARQLSDNTILKTVRTLTACSLWQQEPRSLRVQLA